LLTNLLPSAHSPAFLAADSVLKRLPRAPDRPRQPEFFDRYESRALFYDCFWHADQSRVLLVGPPPRNLLAALGKTRFTAQPSDTPLTPKFHISESAMITELSGVPAGSRGIRLLLAGQIHNLPIQPNSSPELKGTRVVFTMSKDNDLAWIAEWAHYHASIHGADAVIFFDNGSSRYGVADIEQTLLSVPGIARAAVHSWPYIYGAPDKAVRVNPFYTQFLQVSAMSVALRRYAASASGLLNCDIDELVCAPGGQSVFALAARSPQGLVVMKGQFIEPVAAMDAPEQRTHRHFHLRHVEPAQSLSRPKKWALDPSRAWVKRLGVHPYMHWVRGRPWFSKSTPDGLFYWHFRGISTNWKDRRADAEGLDLSGLEVDAHWAEMTGQL
jgi:hypothetical protein